jgi:hypothetical protein
VPHFIAVDGPIGSGKTLNACVMAHYWAQMTGGDARLFANFELKGATLFDRYEVWYEVAEALGSIIIWDEAQLQFDRRQWAGNVIETQIMNMTRKLRAVHIFCTPVVNTLDARILDLIEILIRVRKRENVGVWLDFYEYQAKQFGPVGRYIKTKFMPWKNVRRIFKLNLYDTYQMVYPFSVPKTQREQTEFLKQLHEHHQLALKRERESKKQVEEHKEGWYLASDLKAERKRAD